MSTKSNVNTLLENMSFSDTDTKPKINLVKNTCFGYTTESDIRSFYENKNGMIGKRGRNLMLKDCLFFASYYPYYKDQLSKFECDEDGVQINLCPVLQIKTTSDIFNKLRKSKSNRDQNSGYATIFKHRLENMNLIQLYCNTYLPSNLEYDESKDPNKRTKWQIVKDKEKNVTKKVTVGFCKAYMFNPQGINILFHVAMKENVITKDTFKNAGIVKESVFSKDEIEKMVDKELKSGLHIKGVSVKDITEHYENSNPQIKQLQNFDNFYNETIKSNDKLKDLFEILKRKSNVSVTGKNGYITSCALRSTSNFCCLTSYKGLEKKVKKEHPKWNSSQVDEYMYEKFKNDNLYRENIKNEICQRLGLTYSTVDIYEWDAPSSITKLLHYKHTGEYEKGDCYKKIFDSVCKDEEWNDKKRGNLKDFTNRTVFSSEKKLFQNLLYTDVLNTDKIRKMGKTKTSESVRELQKSVFDYVGNNDRSNQVFLDESYIMSIMVQRMMKEHPNALVVQIYDCIMIFDKNIAAWKDVQDSHMLELHEKATKYYYSRYYGVKEN